MLLALPILWQYDLFLFYDLLTLFQYINHVKAYPSYNLTSFYVYLTFFDFHNRKIRRETCAPSFRSQYDKGSFSWGVYFPFIYLSLLPISPLSNFVTFP